MKCCACHTTPEIIGEGGADHFITVNGDPWCASCIVHQLRHGIRDTSWLVGILVGLNRTQRFRGPRYWLVAPTPTLVGTL